MRLYSSAVDKFEKVLALKPDNVSVLVTCGLALKDMALCMSLDDPDTLINLEVKSSGIRTWICLNSSRILLCVHQLHIVKFTMCNIQCTPVQFP